MCRPWFGQAAITNPVHSGKLLLPAWRLEVEIRCQCGRGGPSYGAAFSSVLGARGLFYTDTNPICELALPKTPPPNPSALGPRFSTCASGEEQTFRPQQHASEFHSLAPSSLIQCARRP